MRSFSAFQATKVPLVQQWDLKKIKKSVGIEVVLGDFI
jgi:hypothetical protein